MKKQNYIHPISQIEVYACLERVMGVGDPTSTAGTGNGQSQFPTPARTIYM